MGLGNRAKHCQKEFAFIFKVEINSSLTNACQFRNCINIRLIKAQTSKFACSLTNDAQARSFAHLFINNFRHRYTSFKDHSCIENYSVKFCSINGHSVNIPCSEYTPECMGLSSQLSVLVALKISIGAH